MFLHKLSKYSVHQFNTASVEAEARPDVESQTDVAVEAPHWLLLLPHGSYHKCPAASRKDQLMNLPPPASKSTTSAEKKRQNKLEV